MITKSKQDWSIGSVVKVGFMTLTVTGITATPGDYKPDSYQLVNSKGVKYEFVPYNGLTKL